MSLRLNAWQLRDLIEQIEAGGGDATELKRELEALGPLPKTTARTRRGLRVEEEEPTTKERLEVEVGDLFPDGITDELLARLEELDRNHSLEELRAMCREAGLSSSGHKKKLAAKLVAECIL